MNTETKSYKDSLTELRANLVNMLPKDAHDAFDNDAESLQSNHQSILKLKVGDKAPDFSLSNATDETIVLSDLLKKGKVVLTFYRGSWCPYCNLQLNHYQGALSEIKALGAELVAISPQTPDNSLNLKEKNALDFEVLSDNGNIITQKFTTIFRTGDPMVEIMAGLGVDFDEHYSDNSREIPVPAVFIIEKDATISFAKSTGGDFRNRVDVSEILDALKK